MISGSPLLFYFLSTVIIFHLIDLRKVIIEETLCSTLRAICMLFLSLTLYDTLMSFKLQLMNCPNKMLPYVTQMSFIVLFKGSQSTSLPLHLQLHYCEIPVLFVITTLYYEILLLLFSYFQRLLVF